MERVLVLVLVSAAAAPPQSRPQDLCGSEQAEMEYERLQYDEYMSCLSGVVNMSEVRQRMLDVKAEDEVAAVVTAVCSQLPHMVRCTGAYVSSLGPCLDADGRRERELWRRLRLLNMEFACGGGRAQLVRFIEGGGLHCVASRRPQLSRCVQLSFPQLAPPLSDTQMVRTLAVLARGDAKCGSLRDVEACIDSELGQCVPPGALGIISQYFRSLHVLFNCSGAAVSPAPIPEDEQSTPESREAAALRAAVERLEELESRRRVRLEAWEAADWRILRELKERAGALAKAAVLGERLRRERRRQ